MNDNDIINELGIRLKEICEFCACVDEDEPTICGGCTFHGVKIALSVINRQKAEIEELQKRIVNWRDDIDYRPEKERAEAIKEFAEKLKERKYKSSDWSHGEHPYCVEESDIDDIAEEMTEK